MTDQWATISALATGGGTLVLALATFASVRSANRAARAAERSLLAGIRPLLIASRPHDPPEKVGFADDHWIIVEGGRAAAQATDEALYFAIALKNAGTGMAVLDRWYVHPDREQTAGQVHEDPATFRRLTRDLYIGANELGFWQGAIRDRDDPQWHTVERSIKERRSLVVDLLYADLEGGQRTITRFGILARSDDAWITSVSRHWFLDQANPR
jgi:hypothetical protein